MVYLFNAQEWTIIRTGEIINDVAATHSAILTADVTACGNVHGADLSNLILKTLITPGGVFTRKELTAFDPSLPSTLRIGGAEGFAALADSRLD